jgi:hypothetical protein
MIRAGLPVSSGLVILADVNDGQLSALTATVPPGQALAARSSAAREDGPGAFFDGRGSIPAACMICQTWRRRSGGRA